MNVVKESPGQSALMNKYKSIRDPPVTLFPLFMIMQQKQKCLVMFNKKNKYLCKCCI